MSRTVKAAPILIALFLCACGIARAADAPLRRAPEISSRFILNGHDYPKLSLKSLRGKVIVLFFWSGTDGSIDELAATLNAWYARQRSKGLEVIGVHVAHWQFQEPAAYVFENVEKYAIKFPVITDPDVRLSEAYGQFLTPSVFLVDKKGFLRFQQSGVIDTHAIAVTLETLLEEVP